MKTVTNAALCCLTSLGVLGLGFVGQFVFGQDPGSTTGKEIPPVLLSDQHQQMVKTQVGDAFPSLSLPTAKQPDGELVSVQENLGSGATVIAVWHGESMMAKSLLRDLSFDILDQYQAEDGQESPVSAIAIATQTRADQAIQQSEVGKYEGQLLLDARGEAFAELGEQRLPRVYVLDAEGNIVWFDIEYSQSSRREMNQAVAALVDDSAD